MSVGAQNGAQRCARVSITVRVTKFILRLVCRSVAALQCMAAIDKLLCMPHLFNVYSSNASITCSAHAMC
jgi:hypothetical protein